MSSSTLFTPRTVVPAKNRFTEVKLPSIHPGLWGNVQAWVGKIEPSVVIGLCLLGWLMKPALLPQFIAAFLFWRAILWAPGIAFATGSVLLLSSASSNFTLYGALLMAFPLLRVLIQKNRKLA